MNKTEKQTPMWDGDILIYRPLEDLYGNPMNPPPSHADGWVLLETLNEEVAVVTKEAEVGRYDYANNVSLPDIAETRGIAKQIVLVYGKTHKDWRDAFVRGLEVRVSQAEDACKLAAENAKEWGQKMEGLAATEAKLSEAQARIDELVGWLQKSREDEEETSKRNRKIRSDIGKLRRAFGEVRFKEILEEGTSDDN